jgi:hypothetical protein
MAWAEKQTAEKCAADECGPFPQSGWEPAAFKLRLPIPNLLPMHSVNDLGDVRFRFAQATLLCEWAAEHK